MDECQIETLKVAIDPSESHLPEEVMESLVDVMTDHLDSKGYKMYSIFWNGKG